MVQQTKQQRPNFGGFVSLFSPLWLVALVLNDDERETWLRAFLSNGGRRTRLHRFSPRDTTYVTQRSVAQPRLTVCQKQCALEQTQTQNELSDNHSNQSSDLFASSAFPQADIIKELSVKSFSFNENVNVHAVAVPNKNLSTNQLREGKVFFFSWWRSFSQKNFTLTKSKCSFHREAVSKKEAWTLQCLHLQVFSLCSSLNLSQKSDLFWWNTFLFVPTVVVTFFSQLAISFSLLPHISFALFLWCLFHFSVWSFANWLNFEQMQHAFLTGLPQLWRTEPCISDCLLLSGWQQTNRNWHVCT